MVKTGNGTPNRTDVCSEAAKEWNKIKSKSREAIDDVIRNYLATSYNLYDIQTMRPRFSVPREDLIPLPTPTTIHSVDPIIEISVNASAQRKAANEITIAEKKLTEFEQINNITTDSQLRNDMYLKIENLRSEIESNRKRIKKLKRNANYSQKCREKKCKIINENQEVIQYDKPGRPPLLFENPNLHDQKKDEKK
ncbi:unnamed protein product [Rhizophagus irregularis]|nr:unnamed protein product [Rhizophagus irregularis]